MLFTTTSIPDHYLAVISRIDQMRLRLRFQLQQEPRRWTGQLRRFTFASAIAASNSIEGFNVTTEEALAAVDGDEPVDERTEAWIAVRGYREAMSFILQLKDDPEFRHHEALLRSMHFMMTSYDASANPGRWRSGAIFIREAPTNKIVYEGPDAGLLPQLLAELIGSLNALNSLPVIVRAALAHLNLVMIHPFSDGNGRMSRALQSLTLIREGVLDPTFSSIEEYLAKHTPDYYRVLGEVGQGSWHPENNALPWLRFCLTAHYRQAEMLLRRTEETVRLSSIFEAALKSKELQERSCCALLDAAMGLKVRNASYRRLTGLPDASASRDLAALAAAGLLVAHGAKRGRYYEAGDWVKQTHAEIKLAEIETDPFTGESAPIAAATSPANRT
jgi:Fic family protein